MANAYRNLNAGQRRLAKRIVSIGRKRGASRQEIIAALSTARVEANYSNPRGGDGTSVGWRQETASSYPGVNRRDVNASINRFYNETKAFRGKFRTSGQLAQRVQRSAFPARYDQHRGESKQIYRALAKGDVGGGGGGSSTSVSFPAPKLGGTQIADLLRTELGQSAPSLPPLGDIPAPAHSAQNLVPMPKGPVLQPVATAAPQVDVDGLAEQLRGIEGLRGPKLQQLSVTTTGGGGGSGGGAPKGKLGTVVGHPLDRAGVRTNPAVVKFAQRISGITGFPTPLGTGTAHDKMTVNGNVSAHWGGNALDMPARGRKLILMGRAALVAAGMSRARARKINGGLFNIGHWQIIFNTQEGGDHTDHLHAGRR